VRAAAGAALLGCRGAPGWCAALASGRATQPLAGTEVATDPLAERMEDARSRPAWADRTREHTRSPERFPRRPEAVHSPARTVLRHAARSQSGEVLRAAVLTVVLLALTPSAAEAERVPSSASTLWAAPLLGAAVTRPFDALPHRYAAGHRGVDLGGAPGAPVLAAGDGVVVFAGMVAGRPVVSVDHADGLRTTYEPVAASVGAGQPVARGSPLGTLVAGHACCPAAACLHWGLRRGEDYLDPLSLLAPPEIRLLPL
jgi:murein DD-endopeptidase MepM/ murein hydrolase activator NlpD